MNTLTLFLIIFFASALLLVMLLWFFGLLEWRRFVSYEFPEAWREFLASFHSQYSNTDSKTQKKIERELLILMGKLDFETDRDHFSIEQKIRASIMILEQKIKAKKVMEISEGITRLENQTFYIKADKKNEER